MITPRRTRLLKVPNLRAFHRAIADASCPPAIEEVRSCAVIVSTTAAASELRFTLENLLLLGGSDGRPAPRGAIVLPDLLTRDEWYGRMHDRLSSAPPRLSRLEREVLASAAARDAITSGLVPPFRLRPGLVSEVLAFYDELQRHRRTIDAFERLLVGELEPRAETDRGAERLLRQTRFLVATWRGYERRRAASGGVDEHGLRELLLVTGDAGAYVRVVVTVGDRACDAAGLYPADFDLLTRLAGLEALDVVATEEALDAGLGERLRDMLPGIEDVAWASSAPAEAVPVPRFFASRDREDELADVARALKADRRGAGDAIPLGRTAVVYRRPLPYVYLAQTVFDAAAIPFQAADALPLAAEPYSAALDLVLSFVESGFTRASATALLACPHLRFGRNGDTVDRTSVSALDRALAQAGFLGGQDELATIAAGLVGPAAPAARAAALAAHDLIPLVSAAPASEHVAVLAGFLERHDRRRAPGDEVWERHQRARSAIITALEDLRAAHLRHDDPAVEFVNVAATIRRWIEAQTFSPRSGNGGVHLVDADAARYGDYDEVFLVGLVEPDWPGGVTPNIFYPSFLLNQLGWPAERARLAGTRAAFLDLLGLPRRALTLSAFTLEEDTLVERSSLLEDVVLDEAPANQADRGAQARIFIDEAIVAGSVSAEALPAAAAPWLAMRLARTPASDSRFHGLAGPYVPEVYSVSAVDLYIECPFKFFATYVLRIEEEPEDEDGLSARARGEFIHDVLRAFFAAWQEGGGRAVTAGNLDEARRLFTDVAGRALDGLTAADAAVERLRLLGLAVAPGAGEITLGAEAASPWAVTERLLEQPLDGTFEFTGRQGIRRLRLRGKADRIDLLEGGRFRIVDYKSGRAPEWRRSIQLPIYAVSARQWLGASRGGTWEVAEAAYLAFAGRDNVRVLVPDARGTDRALAAGQQRFLDAVDGLARGEFPPRPAELHLCSYCRFATVCRKDYVVDE